MLYHRTKDSTRNASMKPDDTHFHHESYCRKCNYTEIDNESKGLRPFGCKCQTLSEKMVGDGCDECNKALAIEMLTDEKDELANEVARLRKYVEKLEIYSPENDWSHPEWRKLIGSKDEQEDPETLFKLYQFRLELDIRGETNEVAKQGT